MAMDSETFDNLGMSENLFDSQDISTKGLSSNFGYRKEFQNDDQPRTFYFNSDEIPSEIQHEEQDRKENLRCIRSISSYSTSSAQEESDSIRSGDSFVKHYIFDTSKYNADTDKCEAFWRMIMYETDLEPADCSLTVECTEKCTEQQELAEKDEYIWYQALLELQKRKMDETALAAAGKQCKFCDTSGSPYTQFKQRQAGDYSGAQSQDSADIIELNNWVPKSIPKEPPKAAVPHKELLIKKVVQDVAEDPRIDCWQFDWPDEPILESDALKKDQLSPGTGTKQPSRPPTQEGIKIDCWEFDWPNKEEDTKCCTCGEVTCDCNKKKHTELEAPEGCRMCQGPCQCAELDAAFLNQLDTRLQQIYKDKTSETRVETVVKPLLSKKCCLICDRTICHPQEKTKLEIKKPESLEHIKEESEPPIGMTQSQLQLKDRIHRIFNRSAGSLKVKPDRLHITFGEYDALFGNDAVKELSEESSTDSANPQPDESCALEKSLDENKEPSETEGSILSRESLKLPVISDKCFNAIL